MVSATGIFTSTQRIVLTAILLALIAGSALAACYHDALDRPVSPNVEAKTGDYVLWHRLESGSSGLDPLNESVRLFSTIADKLASRRPRRSLTSAGRAR